MSPLFISLRPFPKLIELINLYPQILSGRKNIDQYEIRLQNNISIIKKFIKITKT